MFLKNTFLFILFILLRFSLPAQDLPNELALMVGDHQERFEFQKWNLFQVNPTYPDEQLIRIVSNPVCLSISEGDLYALFQAQPNHLQLSIPGNSGQKGFELMLVAATINTESFGVVSEKGERLPVPDGRFYRGIIDGDLHSYAAVSIFRDRVRIVLSDEDGNYVLGRVGETPTDYVLYNDRNLKESNPFECAVHSESAPGALPEIDPAFFMESSVNFCLQVYIECDYKIYLDFGQDPLALTEYMLALFNESAVVYYNEMINIEITELLIWTSQDPYSGTECDAILDNFVENVGFFPGDVAHLVSSRVTGDGGFCGKANGIGELCGAPYCVSAGISVSPNNGILFPLYSWELNVFTHEMGHVFGSQHTHGCYWAGGDQIDDCGNITAIQNGDDPEGDGCYDALNQILPSNGGFIMSYCHQLENVGMNISLGFGSQSGNRVRDHILFATFSAPLGDPCIENECDCSLFFNRTVMDNPLLGFIDSEVYEAGNNIYSQGTVGAGQLVIFQAGNIIELQDGFTVNGLFIAESGGEVCDFSTFTGAIAKGKHTPFFNSIERETTGMLIYPNPAEGLCTLQLQVKEQGRYQLTIYNLFGQTVMKPYNNIMLFPGGYSRTLETGTLPDGVYYVILEGNGIEVRKPLVVQK